MVSNMNNKEVRESYQFFKDNYNIDFSKLSPNVTRQAIDLINKKLDEKIAEEERKIADLLKMISNEHAKIIELNDCLRKMES